MSTVDLTLKNFDEVTGSGLVLVDFWAGWCMPCRMVAPVIEQLAKDYEGRVIIGKVDTDQERQLAERFEIMSIPTVILFENGREVKRIIGVQQKRIYESALDS